MEDIKRALGTSVFLRDVARLEPGKKGVQVGEVLRIYEEKGGYTLAFLKGTDEKTRRTYRDRLDTSKIAYKVGADFSM